MSELFDEIYKPDVLSCLSDLSNDEVFTPPWLANKMLDLLPEEIWSDPNIKILDPACKSGVFLREAAKRFIEGEKGIYPDLQERLDHIYHKQLYGIAITELTSLMSRRSLYCSKYPNGKFSISKFDNPEGNIRYRITKHDWDSHGKCTVCGASFSEFGVREERGLESYAYEFIHLKDIKELKDMKFDVIISNPPYQLSDGGFGISATPIYNKFIDQAKKLNPRYISMIIPARWFAGGKGLNSFRDSMLHDRSIRIIHDYPNADDCFSGVQIKGGIMYFLWDRDNKGDCTVYTHRGDSVSEPEERPLLEPGCDTFIRYNIGVEIFRKVQAKNEESMEKLVSSRKPFGLPTTFHGHQNKNENDIAVYENNGVSYISIDEIPNHKEWVNKYKVFIPRSSSGSDSFPHPILGKPFIGKPGTACSETYIVIGPFENEETCKNVISYIHTKFMRTMAMFKKVTQSTTKALYTLVPIQDFSHSWNDEMLYEKYGITKKEQDFIDSMITPMEGKAKEEE